MTQKPQKLTAAEAKRRKLFYKKMAYIEMRKQSNDDVMRSKK